jgi:rhodanese-related sulfurtransferase
MQTLNAEQVRHMQEQGEDFVLINVLPEPMFRKAHLPGSHNIPVDDERFLERIEELAGGRDRKIVVYCKDLECPASPKAAKKLIEAGYTDVYDYEAGTQGWADAGLQLEGRVAERSSS